MGHTATQPAPPVPAYSYPQGFPAGFVLFHTRNPWCYEGIVRRARQLKARGFTCVGVRYCLEDLRYSEETEQLVRSPGVEYGLDNNFSTWYGRLIEAQEEDLRGFFRLRRTSSEMALADPTQTALEFD